MGVGGDQCSRTTADDSTSIPANMVSLFQQFLASMGNNDMAGKSQAQGQNIDHPEQIKMSEQEKTEKDAPVEEITESSTQGEARGMSLSSGPYCYRC
jgi:hypothetical protein